MINVIRKNQQALMIVVTILVIISFIAFYNGTRGSNRGGSAPGKVASIYNRSIMLTEFQRDVRQYYVARQLGLADLVQILGSGNNQNEQVQEFVFNQMVLQHEAAQLQVSPTDSEVQAEEKRIFQTNGQFDAQKLNSFVEMGLAPLGFNGSVIDDLVTRELQLRKLRALVGSSVAISPVELRTTANQLYQNIELSVIRFSLDESLAGIEVSDEDVKKTYEQRKEGYKSEEQRKITYVAFALSDAENALKDTNLVTAQQKLANRANDFMNAASAKDANFAEVAAQFKVPVTETAAFTQSSPDPKLEKLPTLAAAAFKLIPENPTEAVPVEKAYYIVHLDNVTPSRPLSLDEAKPKIIAQLKSERARETISLKSAMYRTSLETALKSGKSLEDAAKDLKLTTEKIPPFTLAEFPKDAKPDLQQLAAKSMEMKEGQLSEFIPTATGGCLLLVEKRVPLDDAKFATIQAKLASDLLSRKQTIAFLEWLRLRREASKIQFAQR